MGDFDGPVECPPGKSVHICTFIKDPVDKTKCFCLAFTIEKHIFKTWKNFLRHICYTKNIFAEHAPEIFSSVYYAQFLSY